MKDNKKKVILFFAIILVAIVVVVLAIIFGKKEEYSPSGSTNVIYSLNATSQSEIDNEIKNDLEKNNYRLNNAKVYVNPYGNSPLSALIVFKTDKKTTVKTTLVGKNNDDIVTSYDDVANEHYIPVYGLYSDYVNIVKVELGTGETQDISIKIEKLGDMPQNTVLAKTQESLGNDIYFLASPISMNSFAVDNYGEVRWYTDKMYYHDVHVLDNGHLLIGAGDVNDSALSTRIIEIDLLGRLYNEYEVDEGYLNDFFVKEDGNIIVASKKEGRNTFSDYIIEIDAKTGKIVKTWDLFQKLKEIDVVYTNGLRDDFFYNSGIEYYSDSDSLLLTYWGGEFVINLSYNEGTIKWIFSNPNNFTGQFSNLLLRGPEGFTYPKGMHSATLDGNILKVFDNGFSTIKNDGNSANLIGSYSSANTYKINGNNIELVSSIDRDKALFSYALADYKISTNSEVILFGRELKDFDYTRGANINEYSKLVSRIMEYKDGNLVLDMEVEGATQVVEKINLSNMNNFSFEQPLAYTTLKPAEKEDITEDMLKQIKSTNEKIEYEIGYSKNKIEHNAYFMKPDEAKLILIDDNEKGAVYTIKVKDESTKSRIVTDLDKGKYYVYILENGVMYKTDSYIEIK